MRPDFVHEIQLAPAFHDVDPMAVVWHGHYFKYFELARCALLSKFDYDYRQMQESGFIWPIVDLRAKYVRSATFGQLLKVRARIVEWEFRLKIEYMVRDAASEAVLTRAHTIQIAVDLATREMCLVSPPVLLQRLGIAA